MKYLTKFETQAAYEAAESGLILPNVSLTVDNNTVHYNPIQPTPPTPTHDYVEIDGIKWATMNVGANSITDAGLYFQWGDTQGYTAAQVGSGAGQKYFGWEDYKYTNDSGSTMTKYNDTDGLIALTSDDDAATAAWGGSWRMPTTDEFAALGNAVNTAWTDDYRDSGVGGVICTDKTDSSKVLFFPVVGYAIEGDIAGINEYAAYFSSSLSSDKRNAYGFSVDTQERDPVWWTNKYTVRNFGGSIRGVLDE